MLDAEVKGNVNATSVVTLSSLYGHLFPGNDEQAAGLLDDHLRRPGSTMTPTAVAIPRIATADSAPA